MTNHQLNTVTYEGTSGRIFSRDTVSSIHDALRTKQWTKNLLIFAGLVFSKNMFTVELLKSACEAFVLFCLLSSSIYLINDVVDIDNDRIHPHKRLRPIASGRLSVPAALTLAALLASSSIICAFTVDTTFAGIAIAYFILMNLYTLYFKRVATVDVLIISAGFIIRAVAGAAVLHVTISQWLIICTTFLALFMALCKRRHELISLGSNARKHRHTLTQYSRILLDQFIAVASTSTVISYTLYTLSPHTVAEYGTTDLVYSVSLVVFAIFRYLYLVYQKNGGGNPEVLIVTDVPLLSILLSWIVFVIVIIYV